jgi:circadian clock protein KaiB
VKRPALKRAALTAAAKVRVYKLRLYITGNTPRSQRSLLNVRSLCEKELAGRYQLEVIDIYQQPEMAREQQIIAAPTLIRATPLPLRRLVGDFSDRERVMAGLDIAQSAA